jgi:hypothetical protein
MLSSSAPDPTTAGSDDRGVRGLPQHGPTVAVDLAAAEPVAAVLAVTAQPVPGASAAPLRPGAPWCATERALVGHHADGMTVAQLPAERSHQGGPARAGGTADPDPQRSLARERSGGGGRGCGRGRCPCRLLEPADTGPRRRQPARRPARRLRPERRGRRRPRSGRVPAAAGAAVAGPVTARYAATRAASSGSIPAARAAQPSTTGWCGPAPSADLGRASAGATQTARAVRSSPRPWLREASRSARETIRASVSPSSSASVSGSVAAAAAAAIPAPTRPALRSRRSRRAARVATSTTRPRVRACSTPVPPDAHPSCHRSVSRFSRAGLASG